MIARLKRYVKAKYFWSVFLVCGVLSISIGTPPPEDKLVKQGKELVDRFEEMMCVNRGQKTPGDGELGCGEKNPALLTAEEMDGPDFKTMPLNDQQMRDFTRDFGRYKAEIEKQSESRALAAYDESGGMIKKNEHLIQGAVQASLIYFGLQQQLYTNYMRLAHETPWKAYRRLSVGDKIVNHLAAAGQSGPGMTALYNPNVKTAQQLNREQWEAKNAEALKSPGAGAYKKDAYDGFNLRLNERVGLEFYHVPDYGLKFNVRHAKNEKTGGFERIELFLSEEDKRLMEYSALSDPRSKDEYMKLLQFAALREGLVNRWSLRRLVSYETFDGWKVDAKLASCAPELVSFRIDQPAKGPATPVQLSATPMYVSLWQEDTHATLLSKAKEIADKMTRYPGIADRPEVYAELIVHYYSKFASGPAFFAQYPSRQVLRATLPEKLAAEQREFHERAINALSDRDALVKALAIDPYYAPMLMGLEKDSWTTNAYDAKSELTPAREAFVLMNLPADDLSTAAIAERYSWKSAEFRKATLIKWLANMAKDDGLPEAQTRLAPKLAAEAIREFLDGKDPKRTYGWTEFFMTHHVYQTGEAVKEFAWRNYAYVKERARARYDEFKSGVKPLAVKGVLGYQTRKAAEKLLENYDEDDLEAPTGPRYIKGQRVQTRRKNSYEDYQESIAGYKSDDLTPYIRGVPFRTGWQVAGLTRATLPSTPEQVQSFFYKKVSILAKSEYGLAEERIAKELEANGSAMHGMSLVFDAIAKAYGEAKKAKHPDAGLPPAMKMAASASKGKGGKGAAVAGCQPVLTPQSGSAPTKTRGPAQLAPMPIAPLPAIVPLLAGKIGQAKPVEEKCVATPVDEELADRTLLESVIVDAAKQALKEYDEALVKAPTYKYPERAKKASERVFPFGWNPVKQQIDAAQPPLLGPYVVRPAPSPSPSVSPLPALDAKNRRFRPGRDQTYAMNDNPAYAPTPEARKRARELVVEGLAMLGIGHAVTGQNWSMKQILFRPHRVQSFLVMEHFIARQLPKATLLERMVGTLTDQLAIGQTLEQEAYARSPILMIQDSWEPKSEEDAPNLLARLSPGWTVDRGWDDAVFEREFRNTVVRAVKNDAGKVETYCKADLRRYEDDVNFHKMFGSISGIRAALAAIPGASEWDEQIKKEARTQKQIFLAWLDRHGMIIFIGMMCIIAWQFLPIILAAVNAGGAAGLVSLFTAQVGKFVITRIGWLMLTGNLAPINILFTTQTVLMISLNFYHMPPQIRHHFEVANSQITKTSLGGYLLDRNLADREQMQAMRKELSTNQAFTYFAAVAEVGAFAGFTVPGVYRTLGFKGADRAARLAKGLDPKISDAYRQLSMRDLIKQYGYRKGIAMYGQRIATSISTLERAGGTIAGAQAKAALYESAALQLGKQFKSKEEFARFLDKMYGDTLEQARRAMRASKASQKEMEAWAVRAAAQEHSTEALEQVPELRDFFRKMRQMSKQERATATGKFVAVARANDGAAQRLGLVKSKAQAELDALVAAGKAQDLLDDLKMIQEMQRTLRETKVVAGEPELQNFFRGLIKEGDIEKLRPYYMKFRKEIFEKSTRVEVKKIFADLDYLVEDWRKLEKYVANDRTRARAAMWASGRINLVYDEATNSWKSITAEELNENAELYTTTVAPVESFEAVRRPPTPAEIKAKNAVDRMKAAGKKRAPSSVDEADPVFVSPAEMPAKVLEEIGVQ